MGHLPIVILVVLHTTIAPLAQLVGDERREYRDKATYLYEFLRFVEWPGDAVESHARKVCIAEQDVFDGLLHEALRAATDGRAIEVRVVTRPDRGCHMLFVPARIAASAYLHDARDSPTLTVGESADFLQQGGIIRLFVEDREVRFEVNLDAAERAGLRLSSRLLQLSRGTTGGTRNE